MQTRLDCRDDLLEVLALYSVAALAQIANVSRDMLRRLLRTSGVTFLRAGRVLLVPLSAIRSNVPPLWKTLETAELLRRGPCPRCGYVPTAGAATIRGEKRAALVALLHQLRAYIQATADATPENGASTIQSAGVAVRKTPAPVARAFVAEQGAVSGSVKVTAVVAARRAAYDWEYSVDGGKTWVPTLRARTTIMGLPPGTTVQFRYRAATKTGQGDWSQPTSLIVK